LRNVKSLMRKALKLTGCSKVTKQLCIPLTYPWSTCVDLFADRRTQVALARLFRIFQLLDIAPASVSQAAFERVLAYLLNTGAARPHNSYRELVLAWNRLITLLH